MRFTRFLKAVLAKCKTKFSVKSVKYKILESPRNKGSINIIYILHSFKKNRSGGDKVIYKQSEVINKFNNCTVSSSVLHVDNRAIRFDWFEHEVKFKKDLCFDPSNDFVVIPEIMSIPHARLMSNIGINYAIFVQGGYIMDAYSHNYDELAFAYKNASLILAISEDSAKCIATVYPWATDKIVRIFYSIDANKFKSSQKKENLITYMPRKLSRHINLVKFFLNENLPKGWVLKEIHGLNEVGVTELISKSKIFLSFSELEGLGLPPAEAALSGNHVIGYTGEGAKEYWKEPIFTEVHNGDVKKFVSEILFQINELTEGSSDANIDSARIELADKYSEAAEKQSLLNFIDKAKSILNAKSGEV